MILGILNKIGGFIQKIDYLRQKKNRRDPEIETQYLRKEGEDDDKGEILGALKVAFRNRSDRKFEVLRGTVREVNGENIEISDSLDHFMVEPHDFEKGRLDFRYRGDNLFTEGKDTGILGYYLEDEEGGEYREVKVEDEHDPRTV